MKNALSFSSCFILSLAILMASSCNVFNESWIKSLDLPSTAPSIPITGAPTGPFLSLKTINQIEAGSNPTPVATIGATTYFTATSAGNGTELWKTDGTAVGTVLVKDIIPGPDSPNYNSFSVANGLLYFNVTSVDPSQTGLWRSDGTEAGTFFLNSVQLTVAGPDVERRDGTVVMGGYYYFVGISEIATVTDQRLWRTDGTALGTTLVHSALGWVAIFGIVNGELLIRGTAPATGSEIYATDGTELGTTLVDEIVVGAGDGTYSGYSNDFIVRNNQLFLTASNSTIWISDGTAGGTFQYSALIANAFIFFDNKIYFSEASALYEAAGGGPVLQNAADPVFLSTWSRVSNDGLSLFYYANDGTGIGLYQFRSGVGINKVMDLDDTSTMWTDMMARVPVPFKNNGVIFCAKAGGAGWEPYFFEFGGAATRLVDAVPGATNGCLMTTLTAAADTYALFTVNNPTYGHEVWITDGTVIGTQILKDIRSTGADGSNPTFLYQYSNNGILISANDGTIGAEFWKTEGSLITTTPLANINVAKSSSSIRELTEFGSYLYFAANNGVNGSELWRTDGTDIGTTMVEDFVPGLSGSNPWALTNLGSSLLYFANDSIRFISAPGVAAQTFAPSGYTNFASEWMQGFAVFNNEAYFIADTDETGIELFKTNGTNAGTVLVSDTTAGIADGFDWDVTFHVTPNKLLFTRYTNDWEPWATDGTGPGTVLLQPTADYAYDFFEFNGWTYFNANTLANGTEFWRTDGTTINTTLVKDIVPGGVSSNPRPLAKVGDKFLLQVTQAGTAELWISDGTSVGTVLLKAIEVGTWAQQINPTHTVFIAFDALYGSELWITDGTEAGTKMVKDIWPGTKSSEIENLVVIDGLIYFAAKDGTHGNEPWVSDGTTEGTRLLYDIHSGPGSSEPEQFKKFNGYFYFVADDGLNGKNLYQSPYYLSSF